jgi:hypothetical protein
MRRSVVLAVLVSSFVLVGADDGDDAKNVKSKPKPEAKADGDAGTDAKDGLASQEIMAVIRANLNQVRHCYETLLKTSPQAAGKVTATFVIGGKTGAVTSASLSQSTIQDAAFRGCIIGKIETWRFPKPRGGKDVTVNYPFVFNPL